MGVIFTYMKFLDYRGIFTSLRSLDYWDNFHIPSPQMSCPKKNSESSSVLVWACVHLQLNSQPAPRYRTIPILLWHLLISNTFYSGWEAPSLKMGSVFCFVLFVCLFVCLLFFFVKFFFLMLPILHFELWLARGLMTRSLLSHALFNGALDCRPTFFSLE